MVFGSCRPYDLRKVSLDSATAGFLELVFLDALPFRIFHVYLQTPIDNCANIH
jgi:hypothetical protein